MSHALHAGLAPDSRPAALDHLADGIERELELVTALREQLAAQRAAIAACDTAAVQHSCDLVAHTLQSMESARRARATALEVLGVEPDTLLSDLPNHLGGGLPARLEIARQALRSMAEQTAEDATIHHTILRRTVESGEAYLQALFSSATDPVPVYRTGDRVADAQSGFLLDRKA